DGSTVQQIGGAGMSISSVTEDRAGIIWVATKDQGLLRLERNGALRRFRRSDTLTCTMASDKLTALYDLNDTTLLIGSREVTMMFLDKRTFAFTYWTDSTSIAPSRASKRPANATGWCHALTPLDNDKLWIGFLNFQRSCIADRHTGAIAFYAFVQRSGSETLTCAAMINDTLYAGGWQNGLDVVALGDMSTRPMIHPCKGLVIPTKEEVTAVTRWEEHGLILGIRQGGLLQLGVGQREATPIVRDRSDPASLSSDRVCCLLVDRKGTLWAGTENGLDFHVPGTWRFRVQDIFNDPRGDHPEVFFHRVDPEGSSGARLFTSEGFFVQDLPGGRLRHEPFEGAGRELQPTVMSRDHHGHVMVGTEYGIGWGENVGRTISPALEPWTKGATYSLGHMYQVRGLLADTITGRAAFVIATMGYGVEAVDAATQQILGTAMPKAAVQVNSYRLVSSMQRDENGRYWFGSSNGLFTWHPDDPLLTPENIASLPIDPRSIVVTGEDVRKLVKLGSSIWAVTRSGVLLEVSGDRVKRHTPPEHLRTGMYGLAADRSGSLWITTDNGLLRFDPASGSFLHVPVNDGRRFRKLTSAITLLNDGRMVFCADNALISFQPEGFAELPALPEARLIAATAAGLPLLARDGEVRLSYRSSVIDIGVSAVGLGHPQALLMDYRLEGVESTWRTTSLRDGIRYAGVPVGTYRLLVKVRDAFGRVGPEQVLLTISVAAPFWLTWWFYAIIALAVSGGIFLWSRYKLKQAAKLQAVRNKIASDLHDEVGSSLSSITIGSQLATQLSSGENEQVKQLMARIGETSSESLRSMSDIVWAIDPKNDEGEALVKRMRRIATELLTSKGIDVSFSVTGGVEELKLPMNARKEVVLIFKEALHNVSKYANASIVQVSLHRRNGTLAMSVKDDGGGFDVSLHPDGHGLGSMHRRAASLGSVLTLTSAPGLGTLVGVEVDLTRIRD
ncbi:MAG: two-component regulator propeller domain-containing protein, partial [Flavobacteriales bacterium]